MTTINKQVSASTDDGYETDDTNIQLTETTAYTGVSPGGIFDTGLRWQSINIPQGATISSATLSLYLHADEDILSANIRGIAEDNTATWSSGSRPSQRTKTSATITANEANWGNWGVGNWITISITSVVHEIINRGGWNANNALAIVIEDTAGSGIHFITTRTYDYAGNVSGAKLDITYTLPVGKNTRSTMNVHPGVMFQTLTSGHGY
jgi:type IV pilus assembly protein PilY1